VIWAIGDLQGCYEGFCRLLEAIDFDPATDRLWLAGDLVNRGEGSLETLRRLYEMREAIDVVLGNHDLTLIATHAGLKKSNSTLDPILQAPDSDVLVGWLRSRPLLHLDEALGYVMTHAGIPPTFDLKQTVASARRVEVRLRSEGYRRWLTSMFGEAPTCYEEARSQKEEEQFILSALTRMRYCHPDGRLEYKQKGAPASLSRQSVGIQPWFVLPDRRPLGLKLIFGHWSTLGYYNNPEVVCLDTGCVWGGQLTAMRLDGGNEALAQIRC
jgi:bis(5'-nucleosyl)-tetraphosphatase (symmetrical)